VTQIPIMRHDEVTLLVRRQGVIDRRRHPELAGRIDWLARSDRLVRLLPSIYTTPEAARDPGIRILAAASWDPDAVITGAAAGRLTFLPRVPLPVVSLASGRRTRQPGFLIERRSIPAELIMEKAGIRCTSPALTALDLCAAVGGDGIDAVLRSRRATLAQLWEALALTTCRSGNADRRRLLLDSRSLPWSAAERRAHRLLRAAGIDGWIANLRVEPHGQVYFIDIAFPRLRIAVEIDGRNHADPDNFEQERLRQNDMVLDGWLVLRFTWTMITETPDAVALAVTKALELRRQAA
jgi:very-short-patch-repair endonuclease